MRTTLIPFFLLAVLLTPRLAHATVVQVTLPELAGPYWEPGTGQYGHRVVSFQLPSRPSVVHGVSIRVRGTSTAGQWWCDDIWGPVLRNLGVSIGGGMQPEAGQWYTEQNGYLTPGSFDWTSNFTSYGAATWNFLLDGTGDLSFGGYSGSAIPECYPTEVEATLTVDEVVLSVDGEFPTPANPSTWGRIKAQYR